MERRWMGWGGVVGPTAFISAWVIGAATTSRDYAPTRDTISRLAAIDADSRLLMTAGMITFGLAVPAFALALRRALPGPAWIAAAATGISTLFVAALPVDRSDLVDTLHFVAAGVGYITLALTPFLAARPLLAVGHRHLAVAGVVLAAVSSVALPISLVTEYTGLFQRIGLTATDLWLAATGVALALGLGHEPPKSGRLHRS